MRQTWRRSSTMYEYEQFMFEQNKIMSRWRIFVHNKKLWTIMFGIWTKQEQIPFLATTSVQFSIMRGYLLHPLIFPHSLRIFKDFGMQITNTAVFAKIFIFQKWVLFPIWFYTSWNTSISVLWCFEIWSIFNGWLVIWWMQLIVDHMMIGN